MIGRFCRGTDKRFFNRIFELHFGKIHIRGGFVIRSKFFEFRATTLQRLVCKLICLSTASFGEKLVQLSSFQLICKAIYLRRFCENVSQNLACKMAHKRKKMLFSVASISQLGYAVDSLGKLGQFVCKKRLKLTFLFLTTADEKVSFFGIKGWASSMVLISKLVPMSQVIFLSQIFLLREISCLQNGARKDFQSFRSK